MNQPLDDSQDKLKTTRTEFLRKVEQRLAAGRVSSLDVEILVEEVKRLMVEVDEYRRLAKCPACSSH